MGERGKGSRGGTIGGGSLLENSIFDAIQNVGRRNDGGGQSKSSRVNRITSGGLKQSQNGSRRKTGKRKPSLSRILNNISKGNREQSSIRDDGASFQSEDYSSSNDRINPYKDYVNTAGKYKLITILYLHYIIFRISNVFEQPKLSQISILLLEPFFKTQ